MEEPISDTHMNELVEAKRLLENPSLASKLSNLLGTPIEKGMDLLPPNAKAKILSLTTTSLNTALKTALLTINENQNFGSASNLTHKMGAGLSGAVGGAFGLATLAIELPISTGIMLRSIADIARSEGEDLNNSQVRLACLQVFSLGGPSTSDDASETGYFGARIALAQAVSEAATHLASHSAAKESAPALVRLVTQIATRFSVPVTQKAAAQSVPIIGAVSGAIINTLFINHYQDIAKGHFTVRRLERVYGIEQIKLAYRET